jgi:hypothetical protein
VILGEEIERPAIVRQLLLAVCPGHGLEGGRVQSRWQGETLDIEDRPDLRATAGAGAGPVGLNVSGPVVECHTRAVHEVKPYAALVGDADRLGTGGGTRNRRRIS